MKDDIERGEPGPLFEDFLEEEDILEETTQYAIKSVPASRLADEMAQGKLSRAAMARCLGTSRYQLERLLDPERETVSLVTLSRAARAVGWKLRLELYQGS